MTPQIRLNQFINAIVIGVLFQGLILLFAKSIFKIDIYILLKSFDAGVLIAGIVILSFPSWRLVSNFVGFILEPVSNQRNFKNFYIKLFFGIKTEGEEGRIQVLKSIINGNSDYTNWQKRNIEDYFKINLNKLTEQELYSFFEVIKGTVNISPTEYQGQQSEQHNLVSNFHARLAVLLNSGFWLSILSTLINIWMVTQYSWWYYIVSAFIFYLLGRHFGLSTDTKSEGYRLIIADFMAVCTKLKSKDNKTNG